VRIVIAEDSVLLRDGLARLLTDKGHEVVAAVGDADALLAAAGGCDLVITDIRMPPSFTDEGLRAALEIRRALSGVSVLVLSQYVVDRYAADLLRGDVRGVGYLLKDRVADVRDFLDAVARVGSGGTVLDPEVVSQLLGRTGVSGALAELTPRERDVLEAMAQGRTNAAISAGLHISEGSVEKHISAIFAKLQLSADGGSHRRVLAVLAYLGVAV
jgi:DNA-binding NarL/FixJ family response regulator